MKSSAQNAPSVAARLTRIAVFSAGNGQLATGERYVEGQTHAATGWRDPKASAEGLAAQSPVMVSITDTTALLPASFTLIFTRAVVTALYSAVNFTSFAVLPLRS